MFLRDDSTRIVLDVFSVWSTTGFMIRFSTLKQHRDIGRNDMDRASDPAGNDHISPPSRRGGYLKPKWILQIMRSRCICSMTQGFGTKTKTTTTWRGWGWEPHFSLSFPYQENPEVQQQRIHAKKETTLKGSYYFSGPILVRCRGSKCSQIWSNCQQTFDFSLTSLRMQNRMQGRWKQ